MKWKIFRLFCFAFSLPLPTNVSSQLFCLFVCLFVSQLTSGFWNAQIYLIEINKKIKSKSIFIQSFIRFLCLFLGVVLHFIRPFDDLFSCVLVWQMVALFFFSNSNVFFKLLFFLFPARMCEWSDDYENNQELFFFVLFVFCVSFSIFYYGSLSYWLNICFFVLFCVLYTNG